MPELNNLHGKIVLSNIVSILMMTVYLVCVYNLTHTFSPLVCKVSGYLGYFFTMTMFSWMTIMNLDICWTFKRAEMPNKGSILTKYFLYSVASWGWGSLLTFIIVLLDLMVDPEAQRPLPLPGVGVTKCFLEDRAQGLYLHLPILLLMVVNGGLFVHTTTTLHRAKVTTRQARKNRVVASPRRRGQSLRRMVVRTPTEEERDSQEAREQTVRFGSSLFDNLAGALHQAVCGDGHPVEL